MRFEGRVMDQLVTGAQSDIRQVVNMLSTWKLSQGGAMDFDDGKRMAKMNEKNALQTPWTLYGKLFSPQAFSPVSGLSLNDKQELYFHDHQTLPLFVHENYAKTSFSKASGLVGPELQLKRLELVSKAANAISEGDLVERMIRGHVKFSIKSQKRGLC